MTGKNWQMGGWVKRAAEAPCLISVLLVGDIAFAEPSTSVSGIMISDYALPWEVVMTGAVVVAFLIAVGIWVTSVLRLARQSQLRSLAFAAAALNNMSHGIVMIGARKRVLFCNDRFLEMYGLQRSDIRKGLTSRELVHMRRRNGMLPIDTDEYLRKVHSDDAYDIEMEDGRTIAVKVSRLPNGGIVLAHEDCTEQRRLERQLATTKRFLESVIDNIPVCVAVKELETRRYILANRAFEEFAQMPRDKIVGATAEQLFSEASAEAIAEADLAAIAKGEEQLQMQVCVERGGEKKILDSTRVVARDAANNPEFLIALFKDITENNHLSRELEETKKFLELVVDHIPVAVEVQRVSDRASMLVNRQAQSYLLKADAIQSEDEAAYARRARESVTACDNAAIRKGGLHIEERPVQTPNGLRMFLTRRVTIPGENNEPEYLVKINEDVTDRRETESRMAHMAYHDSLTDLPNRAAFTQALEQMIDACSDGQEQFAVLSVDIDQLKDVNDVFGHSFGDKLILAAARRMENVARGGVLARLNGDEFSLIIDGPQPEAGQAMAQKIQETLDREFLIDSKVVRISVTIGVAVFPRDGTDAGTLLANADVALFRAKAMSRGSVRVFEPHMDLQIRDRRALHQDLAGAIRNGELLLHYQPQATATRQNGCGKITGFEALARWFHPTRGLVSPATFIPLAEESGLIVEMGEWILREACREAASWPRPLQISVNLSPAQFKHGDLVGLVHSILLETRLAPARLVLEITEGVLISDFERGLSLLRRLKALGVCIAMDDFGSGYSSLTYLQAFPFDKIKIDQAFVMNLGRNPQSAAIVRAVVGLGHGLGITLVAEGVETKEQFDFLIGEGCDQVQGFLLGRPGPIEAWSAVLGYEPAGERADLISLG